MTNNENAIPKDAVFRPVKDFEELYEVSNYGNVRSLKRTVICKDGQKKPIKSKILREADNGSGYKFVYLWKNNRPHRYYIHRLVAKTFLNNPDNLPEINHIDNNKNNNHVDNLEWCNRLYNERQKERHISGSDPIKVKQIDVNTNEIITIFESISECSRQLHITPQTITKYVKNNLMRTKYGKTFRFEFIEQPKPKLKLKIKVKQLI